MPTETPWGQQAKKYHAQEDRRVVDGIVPGAGAVTKGGLAPDTGGSGLQVLVAAGQGFVRGSHAGVTRQGLYPVYLPSNEAITLDPANGTNPRIDMVGIRIEDTEPAPGVAGDAASQGTLAKVTGTATAGATLANRTGIGTAPASFLHVADVLVPATFTGPFVKATHIRDRRGWAFGANQTLTYGGANITSVPAGAFEFPSNRVELSHESGGVGTGNAIVLVHIQTMVLANAVLTFSMRPSLDGAPAGTLLSNVNMGAAQQLSFFQTHRIVIPLGSHTLGIAHSVSANTATILTSSWGLTMTIQELTEPSYYETATFTGLNGGA